MTYRTLLIDDERPVRLHTKNVLSDFADTFQLVGEASNGREAIEMIDSLQPDLIFLDIQMPDFTGFEVLKRIKHQPIVVFATAYDQFAIKAFEEHSIDYLLKPIEEKRVAKTIEKLKNFSKNQAPAFDFSQLEKLIQQPAKPIQQTIPVKMGQKIMLLKYEDISYFEADEKYVAIYLQDDKKCLTEQTLSNLEAKLPANFLRIQKSCIINIDQIVEIERHFNNRLIFTMNNKSRNKLQSGTSYIDAIREKLGL
jgi:two-component system, LytTR family, response regulator